MHRDKKKSEGGGDRHTHAQTTHLFSIVYDAAELLPALQRAQSTSPPTRFVAFICLLLLRRIGVATIAFALFLFFYLCSSRVLIVF